MIIAATGHRPEKLGGYGEGTDFRLFNLAVAYLTRLRPTTVISGMAQGWDVAWARAAVWCNIPFIAALPFYNQHCKWPAHVQAVHFDLLRKAADVAIVCEGEYAGWKMQRRNEWMVDRADRVAALWDGSPGGTGNCIAYANRVGKPYDNLWTEWTAR